MRTLRRRLQREQRETRQPPHRVLDAVVLRHETSERQGPSLTSVRDFD